MKFRTPRPFWEEYLQLPRAIQAKARKTFKLFRKGAEHPPHHPSLRIRKMGGHADIWEGHVTLDYVFTFHFETEPETGETICVFRRIGTHDIYRNP